MTMRRDRRRKELNKHLTYKEDFCRYCCSACFDGPKEVSAEEQELTYVPSRHEAGRLQEIGSRFTSRMGM